VNAVVAFVFEVIEEGLQPLRREIAQFNSHRRPAGARLDEFEQQPQRVAITLDSARTPSPLVRQVFIEECLQQRSYRPVLDALAGSGL